MMEAIEKRKEIKEKIEKYREGKREQLKKRKEEIKKLRKKKREEILKVRKKFEEVEKRRKEQQEEKDKKMAEMQEEKLSKENIKNKKMIEFLTQEKKKIKKQNKEIAEKKKYILKLQEEERNRNMEAVLHSSPPDYFTKNKEYIEFEKNLNVTINNLIENEDIKKVYTDYDSHLKLIFNIYSKLDNTKFQFNSKEGLGEESFKQFLMNFTILGLLVSSEQMVWIFNTITRQNLKERDNQSYLNFHDFQMALCYLAIYARFAERTRKILPGDVEATNGQSMEYFFKFMGLELPFDKSDLEMYINDRRSMTVKNLINLQQELRKNDVLEFKKKEMEIEEKKKKDMRKKR